MGNERTSQAVELMLSFARRTGLSSDAPPRRYLWTDAFAVCNFLGLARKTGDASLRALALQLVDQVHHELGRHRPDDRRNGWISALHGAEAEAHPTRGGLRIGKPLAERGAREPYDPDLEWDRDGQYFHYLTKWMHALDQAARWTGVATFNVWGRELAYVAHRAFTYGPLEDRRMAWKMSIDLSRPLVSSMGHHDPLDGFVTCRELEATAIAMQAKGARSLAAATSDFARMLDLEGLATSDPLGLGGLLVDACRLVQVQTSPELISSLLGAAVTGLRSFVAQPDLRAPAHRRLAFRELGLAIGLAGLEILENDAFARRLDASAQASLAELEQYVPLATEIEAFWALPYHRQVPTWVEHADINDVMLATSLEPEGFLALGSSSPLPAQGVRRYAADDTP
jgi:hypothetical protein